MTMPTAARRPTHPFLLPARAMKMMRTRSRLPAARRHRSYRSQSCARFSSLSPSPEAPATEARQTRSCHGDTGDGRGKAASGSCVANDLRLPSLGDPGLVADLYERASVPVHRYLALPKPWRPLQHGPAILIEHCHHAIDDPVCVSTPRERPSCGHFDRFAEFDQTGLDAHGRVDDAEVEITDRHRERSGHFLAVGKHRRGKKLGVLIW